MIMSFDNIKNKLETNELIKLSPLRWIHNIIFLLIELSCSFCSTHSTPQICVCVNDAHAMCIIWSRQASYNILKWSSVLWVVARRTGVWDVSDQLHGAKTHAKTHAKTRAKTHAKTHAKFFFAWNCDKPPKCLIKVSCKIWRRNNFVIRGLSQFHAKKFFACVFAPCNWSLRRNKMSGLYATWYWNKILYESVVHHIHVGSSTKINE